MKNAKIAQIMVEMFTNNQPILASVFLNLVYLKSYSYYLKQRLTRLMANFKVDLDKEQK